MSADLRDSSASSPSEHYFRERICWTCGVMRPWAEFAVDRTKASGHKSTCKECDRNKWSHAI